MLLEGLFVPLTTPFYPDGRVYLKKLEHNAERYSRTPAAGLAVLSAGSERMRLSDTERREALRAVAAAAADTTVLLADVSGAGVRETLRLAEDAAAAQYDVLLVEVPSGPEDERWTFLSAVADRAPLPLVLDMREPGDEAWIARAAALPAVVGAVVSSADRAVVTRLVAAAGDRVREVTVTPTFAAVTGRMIAERAPVLGGPSFVSTEALTGGTALAVVPPVPALKTRTKKVGFQVLGGSTRWQLEALRAGARGILAPFAACAPQAMYEVYAAWKDDDQPLAEEKHARVVRAARRIEEEMGVAGLKAACDLTGYYGGWPRLPGLPLQGEQRAEVERLMRGMRN